MKTVLIALMLMGCATAPKTEPSPSPPQQQKAEKTTIQTILDFFEPRD